MRLLRRSLTALLLLSVTVALLAGAGYQFVSAVQERRAAEATPPQARERQFAVNVVRVEPTQIAPTLTSYGEVQARRSLTLRAPQTGRIVALSQTYEEGGRPKAGDMLLQLDPVDAEAALRVAQADVLEAKAALTDAQRAQEIAVDDLAAAQNQLTLREAALKRQNDLVARGVGSAASVETTELNAASAQQSVLSKRQALANAEASVDRAETDVLRAEIALDEAARGLADLTITAAFDGVLSDVSGALGSLVNTNEQVATLIDPAALEIAFSISTEQYSRLLEGHSALPELPVSVSLDVAGLTISGTGRVSRESAAVSEGRTGRQLFAQLDDTTGFRPGDFVSVTITEPDLSDVALIPAAAVDAKSTVLAITENSRLEEIPVSLRRRQGDDVIIDAAALSGRSIVAQRTPLLGAGILVRPNGGNQSGAGQIGTGQGDTGQGGEPSAETVVLSAEQRAKFVGFVTNNTRMPEDVRTRLLEQLEQDEVPVSVLSRLEQRMGS